MVAGVGDCRAQGPNGQVGVPGLVRPQSREGTTGQNIPPTSTPPSHTQPFMIQITSPLNPLLHLCPVIFSTFSFRQLGPEYGNGGLCRRSR